MAWRNIRLYYAHAARAAGASGISSNATFSTPKDHLIDDRGGIITRLSSGANNYIQIDRGAPSSTLNKLYIPAGHELSGCTIKLESDDNSGFSSPLTMLADTAITNNLAINYDTANSGERYLRLTMITSGTWGLGELIISQQRALSRGPETSWTDETVYPAAVYEKRTGARPAAEFGSPLRAMAFDFRRVDPADLAFFTGLELAVGVTRPFLLDAPFDDGGTIWCSLTGPISREFDSKNPIGESQRYYRQRMSVLEWAS
jgi:hypothetical protein